MDRGNTFAPYYVLALAALAVSVLLACGGGASSSSPSPEPGPGQPFVAVTLDPPSVSMARGNQRSTTVTAQAGGGFTGSLALSVSGAPEGLTVNFEPQSIPVAGFSKATVSVTQSTPTGTYHVTIHGIEDGVDQTATLTVAVTAEVLLTWMGGGPGDIIGYNVSRSESSGSGYIRLNAELISSTSYVDDTVQSGHTYYYVATAVNSAGIESTPSDEASVLVP